MSLFNEAEERNFNDFLDSFVVESKGAPLIPPVAPIRIPVPGAMQTQDMYKNSLYHTPLGLGHSVSPPTLSSESLQSGIFAGQPYYSNPDAAFEELRKAKQAKELEEWVSRASQAPAMESVSAETFVVPKQEPKMVSISEVTESANAPQSSKSARMQKQARTSIVNEDPSREVNAYPFPTPANVPPAPRELDPRHNPSLVPSPAKRKRPNQPQTQLPTGPKTLLTAAQKKANHIASEKKRRAAIRQGYEQLCQVVPTLRVAVRDLEARERNNDEDPNRKGRKSGSLAGGIEIGGEKIDGRAGPKSEAIVLSKSVDYVRELLEDRERLLKELSKSYEQLNARGILAPPGRRMWDELWVDGTGADEVSEE